MNLRNYIGKKITIVCTDGKRYSGIGYGMTSAYDEECGIASIDIECKFGLMYCLYEDEIDHIDIVE